MYANVKTQVKENRTTTEKMQPAKGIGILGSRHTLPVFAI